MPLTYTNRKGQTYFLKRKTTKRNRQTFFATQQKDGPLLDVLPDGFEFHERPENGQVVLRRTVQREITDLEVARVRKAISAHAAVTYFQLDNQDDTLTVYTGDWDPSTMDLGSPAPRDIDDLPTAFQSYSPVMQFVLEDHKTRAFRIERWCFRGAIDDWIALDRGTLAELAERYGTHLGRESFYDLAPF